MDRRSDGDYSELGTCQGDGPGPRTPPPSSVGGAPETDPGSEADGPTKGLGPQRGPTTVQVTINLPLIMGVVYGILVAVSSLGTLLVWFEAAFLQSEFGRSSGSTCFTMTIALVLFALSAVPNYFVPSSHRGAFRRFALFLFLTTVDSLVCSAHAVVELSEDTNSDEATMVRTSRAGFVLVLLAAVPAFLITFCTHVGGVPVREAIREAGAMRVVTSVMASALLLLGQLLTWGIKDNCWWSGRSYYLFNVSPLLLAILLVSTTLLGDHGTHDAVFVWMIHYLVVTVPIFPSSAPYGTQSNFLPLYKAALSFLFLGSLFYFLGVFVDRVKAALAFRAGTGTGNGSGDETTLAQRLKSGAVWSQVLLLVLAIPGAIMTWSWSVHWIPAADQNARTANWLAALTPLIPLFHVIAAAAEFPFLRLVGALLSFNVAPMLAWLALGSYTTGITVLSYYRAGVIVQLLVATLATTVAFVSFPKRPINEMFAAPEGRSDASRERPSPFLLFVTWLLASSYAWSESLVLNSDAAFGLAVYPVVGVIAFLSFFAADNTDAQRLVYFQLLMILTNPQMWPLTSTPSISRVFITLSGFLYVAFYSWDQPLAYFDALHARCPDVHFELHVTAGQQRTDCSEQAATQSTPLLERQQERRQQAHPQVAREGYTFVGTENKL